MCWAWLQAWAAVEVSQVIAFVHKLLLFTQGTYPPCIYVWCYAHCWAHGWGNTSCTQLPASALPGHRRGSSDRSFALLSLCKHYAWWILQCCLKCCLLTLFWKNAGNNHLAAGSLFLCVQRNQLPATALLSSTSQNCLRFIAVLSVLLWINVMLWSHLSFVHWFWTNDVFMCAYLEKKKMFSARMPPPFWTV